MSMSDVCAAANVSRTTLYRYFPQKEDLFEGIGVYHRHEFEQALKAMEAAHPEPVDRFRATIDLLQYFIDLKRMAHILVVEPQFAISYLQRHVPYFTKLVQQALEPAFEFAQARSGRRLDPVLMTELLFHVVGSSLIMSDDDVLRRFADMILETWFDVPGDTEGHRIAL